MTEGTARGSNFPIYLRERRRKLLERVSSRLRGKKAQPRSSSTGVAHSFRSTARTFVWVREEKVWRKKSGGTWHKGIDSEKKTYIRGGKIPPSHRGKVLGGEKKKKIFHEKGGLRWVYFSGRGITHRLSGTCCLDDSAFTGRKRFRSDRGGAVMGDTRGPVDYRGGESSNGLHLSYPISKGGVSLGGRLMKILRVVCDLQCPLLEEGLREVLDGH